MVEMPSRRLSKSNAQFQRAVKRLPLGVSSTFRYWGDDRTIYVHHGKGGRMWDIDGNAYVDSRLPAVRLPSLAPVLPAIWATRCGCNPPLPCRFGTTS